MNFILSTLAENDVVMTYGSMSMKQNHPVLVTKPPEE